MITNMIVLLCLSALFPVLMGTDEIKPDYLLVKDCSDNYQSEYSSSGVYTITTIDGAEQVYCEMDSGEQNDRRHWTVILRRMDGEVNFFRRWESYKKGFGNKTGEHWLGDSLYYHNGMMFSTYDKDQDNSGSNCAMIYFGGGFWYNKCYYTNPTGHYLWENDGTLMDTGATWYYWKNSWDPLKSITMKIRRVK